MGTAISDTESENELFEAALREVEEPQNLHQRRSPPQFASVLGSLNAVESSEKLSEEQLNDKRLKDDVAYLTRSISPNIPFIGLISGGCTTAKHVVAYKWKKEETPPEVTTETKHILLHTECHNSENHSNGATHVAKSLGYKQPRNAIRDHVWNENKAILDRPTTRTDSLRQWNFKPNTIFLREPGVYQLIFKSNLPSAKAFQQWVFEEVLPSIRKTGSYELPEPKLLDGKQLKLHNETDLHYAIIRYIRKYHPDARVIAGLGEYQDTVQRRSDAFRKGYLGGQPDILIANPMNGYTGFAIELKTPKGTGEIRENQVGRLRRLTQLGYKTTFYNDYTNLVLKIHEYFRVDLTVKHKKETTNLKKQCNILKQKLSEATACYRPKLTGYKY
ncbi:Hypothetical predicted protein [Paramuricea clavata]|uniref:Uncharacterized protein n=1 Tax=Paramuricea clavata TaxID=317549 RepID=A0A7D9I959_PARCT|nr:Hypothetical predicted protein [Paramuricea clavata]